MPQQSLESDEKEASNKSHLCSRVRLYLAVFEVYLRSLKAKLSNQTDFIGETFTGSKKRTKERRVRRRVAAERAAKIRRTTTFASNAPEPPSGALQRQK